tara:strand:- start:7858 stop:8517 length:660 start_codon:yes stop_codon:yes gene_type:complete
MIEVTYIDHMGSDLSVVNAARVSFGKKSDCIGYKDNGDGTSVALISPKDRRLIHYLAKHKHMSPFGHAFASFHVKAPIFVARQLVKHKFLRWNEVSRRYVDYAPEFYDPVIWRGRADDAKQGSSDKEVQGIHMGTTYRLLQGTYEYLLGKGVAPEQARMILPQSTMTEWYWSGSLDAFSDMCNLRCKEDTQYETTRVAKCISLAMQPLFEVSWEALGNG